MNKLVLNFTRTFVVIVSNFMFWKKDIKDVWYFISPWQHCQKTFVCIIMGANKRSPNKRRDVMSLSLHEILLVSHSSYDLTSFFQRDNFLVSKWAAVLHSNGRRAGEINNIRIITIIKDKWRRNETLETASVKGCPFLDRYALQWGGGVLINPWNTVFHKPKHEL